MSGLSSYFDLTSQNNVRFFGRCEFAEAAADSSSPNRSVGAEIDAIIE
jgi:hypothetical protein